MGPTFSRGGGGPTFFPGGAGGGGGGVIMFLQDVLSKRGVIVL